MILNYVLKNFKRRKVRTILMVLSLMVSTGLIVAMSATVETVRRSNVDLLSSSIGRYDLSVTKKDTSADPFVDINRTAPALTGADPLIVDVFPRLVSDVDLSANGETATATMIARKPEETVGQIDVVSGTLSFENNGMALFESTAEAFGVDIGDEIDVAYSFPRPRVEGEATVVGISQRQVVGRFPVNAIIRQTGVVGLQVSDGLIMDFDQVQSWLGLTGRAGSLIGLVEPELYEAGNAEQAALTVREVVVNVQNTLGEDFNYSLDKAAILDQSSEAFLVLQALINTYGLMAFGVVGLLIHTLVMTNVQEQRREMAVLRILGSQRNLLFAMVMVEVAVIGLIGVAFGIVLGQILTQYAVIPFIEYQMSQAGLNVTIQPAVSLAVILPAVISAFAVLFVSALKPAQDASKTKVMYAINPGVADNIQLEDLEELRVQRPNLRFFVIGLVMMFTVTLVLGLDIVSTLGNPSLEATIFLLAILLMVLGLGLVFLIITRPLERLVLLITGLFSPRLTYFARRNVGRSNKRNALISLLVLFSGVLPSFLATQNAIDTANIETDVKLDMGAPIELIVFTRFSEPELASLDWLQPSFLQSDLGQVEGVERTVGLTHEYTAGISDAVDMRSGSVDLQGVVGDLNEVLFGEMIIFTAGDESALTRIQTEDQAIIISEGLANHLAVPLGGTIKLRGEGLDHLEEFTVIGIVRRLPGFDNFGRIRSQAQNGSTAFVSLDAFHRMSTNPKVALPDANDPVLDRVLATVSPGADVNDVDSALRGEYGFRNRIFTRVAEVRLQQAQDERLQTQLFLIVLTLISFTTAVFGVFAVIYVTIYSRRLEIGMMKAVGSRKWELTGMLIVESIAMTVSAALAGVVAGAVMGYTFAYINNVTSQRPMIFAVDTTVMPFVLIMVVIASIIGTVFSARRIVKYKAIEILRM
ncbi:MAG: FtsX-like permease family protein [Ardenticatenaceae bacterium]|nr:FtsX-like permease family protein [Ardenticatenaceae bacterium]